MVIHGEAGFHPCPLYLSVLFLASWLQYWSCKHRLRRQVLANCSPRVHCGARICKVVLLCAKCCSPFPPFSKLPTYSLSPHAMRLCEIAWGLHSAIRIMVSQTEVYMVLLVCYCVIDCRVSRDTKWLQELGAALDNSSVSEVLPAFLEVIGFALAWGGGGGLSSDSANAKICLRWS